MKKIVIYKGKKVPARLINFGNGISKFIPINTDRYVLYGIPKPKNLETTEATTAIAKNIIKINKEATGMKRTILAKYIREGTIDGFVLKRRTKKDGVSERFVSKGTPIGIMVAFIYDNKLRVGWSKYLEGKVKIDGKHERKEPLVFAKKDAMLIAIERGLNDVITFYKTTAYTKENIVIPKVIINSLEKFIERSEKYFKKNTFNVAVEDKHVNNDKKGNEKIF